MQSDRAWPARLRINLSACSLHVAVLPNGNLLFVIRAGSLVASGVAGTCGE